MSGGCWWNPNVAWTFVTGCKAIGNRILKQETPAILTFGAASNAKFVKKDIITVYLMDSYADIGGSDAWVHMDHMPEDIYYVWHCDHTKRNIWTPNAIWTHAGAFDWATYGQHGSDNAAAAVAKKGPQDKAKPKAAAAKAPSRKRKANSTETSSSGTP